MGAKCSHFKMIRNVSPRTALCEECQKTGRESGHLRMCLTCGHVGCGEDFYGHASQHYFDTQHPMIRSLERGDRWSYCYVDHQLFDQFDIDQQQRASMKEETVAPATGVWPDLDPNHAILERDTSEGIGLEPS